MRFTYSVIIPTLNAEGSLAKCLESIKTAGLFDDVVVVDGGSHDHTVSIADKFLVKVIRAEKGRGRQFNEGAANVDGEILIFLHADTLLPANARLIVEQKFSDPKVSVATFALQFDHPHWILSLYSCFTRIDSIWTRFGDQGIVVRKSIFKELGGFPNIPLFEDVQFLQKCRHKTRIYSLPSVVTTSADKFLRNGLVRQQLRNGRLIFKYLLGTSPETLCKEYER